MAGLWCKCSSARGGRCERIACKGRRLPPQHNWQRVASLAAGGELLDVRLEADGEVLWYAREGVRAGGRLRWTCRGRVVDGGRGHAAQRSGRCAVSAATRLR